jgi:hypothetical protein
MDVRAFLDRLRVPDLPVDFPTAPGQTVTVILDQAGHQSRDYTVCGTTQCVDCGHTVLLGTQSFDAVVSGRALPLCHPCSLLMFESSKWTGSTYIGRVEDS